MGTGSSDSSAAMNQVPVPVIGQLFYFFPELGDLFLSGLSVSPGLGICFFQD
jgi:hypothetical protein